MKNVFLQADVSDIVERINNLTDETEHNWGKMNVSQMLGHLNVTYELVYTDKHPKPNFFVRVLLKAFVKKYVVNNKEYRNNSKTGPQFIIEGDRDFDQEKADLIAYINKTLKLGSKHFDGKESHSFGALNSNEWNAMFYKHLDHHLRQFGV